MGVTKTRIAESGVFTLSETDWELARVRMQHIAPLAALDIVGHQAVDEAARELNLSRRQVYVLIQRVRQGTGLITDLASEQSSGGKSKGRLSENVERLIHDLLQKSFLTKQKRSLSACYRDIEMACKIRNLPVSAYNTVALRISQQDPVIVSRRRGGINSTRELQGAGGTPPVIPHILEQVQIDHTVIDLIIVDERDRSPIGRPYLTIAIDVFSRAILGMVVTLEAPSSVSVGLCLAHAVSDKHPWLERLGVEMDWVMRGKPVLVISG